MRFIAILLFLTGCITQLTAQRKNALLVAEYENIVGSGAITHLVRYHFFDGKLINDDTVITAPVTRPGIPGSYVRYDLGKNFVYKDRYVVSGVGNVIDIKTKSLLVEDTDEFIETRGDSIIFYRSNILKGTGYLVLDLQTRNYRFVQDKNFWNIPGQHNPSHTKSLTINNSSKPNKICIHFKDGETDTLIQDAGVGTVQSQWSSAKHNIPLLWLDDNNFLFAKYEHAGMNGRNAMARVTIKKVNTKTKEVHKVGFLDSVPAALTQSQLYFNQDGNIVFECMKGRNLVDLERSITFKDLVNSLGHGFSFQFSSENKIKKGLFHNGKLISDYRSYPDRTATTQGFLAYEFIDNESEPRQRGVKVWNQLTTEWIQIDIPWVCAVIGWVEE